MDYHGLDPHPGHNNYNKKIFIKVTGSTWSIYVLNVVALLTTNMIGRNMSHCGYNIMYSFSRVLSICDIKFYIV